MSDRVALGALGSGEYGLRVSKPGEDAVSGSTLVGLDKLLFDSVHPAANFPIYGIWDIDVGASTTRTITHSDPALAYIPFGVGYRKVSSTELWGEYWSLETGFSGTPNMRPPEDGFLWEVSTSQIRIQNLFAAARTFRIVLFRLQT